MSIPNQLAYGSGCRSGAAGSCSTCVRKPLSTCRGARALEMVIRQSARLKVQLHVRGEHHLDNRVPGFQPRRGGQLPQRECAIKQQRRRTSASTSREGSVRMSSNALATCMFSSTETSLYLKRWARQCAGAHWAAGAPDGNVAAGGNEKRIVDPGMLEVVHACGDEDAKPVERGHRVVEHAVR